MGVAVGARPYQTTILVRGLQVVRPTEVNQMALDDDRHVMAGHNIAVHVGSTLSAEEATQGHLADKLLASWTTFGGIELIYPNHYVAE
jgi:hypothetical protein